MDPKLIDLYDRLKKSGLTPEQDQKIRLELNHPGTHDLPEVDTKASSVRRCGIFTLSTI